MFSTEHFIWLAISLSITGALLFLSLKFRWKYRTAMIVMCVIAACSELLKIFTHIETVNVGDGVTGGYMRAVSLPFHICSIFIFAYFYLALSKNERRSHIVAGFFVPIGLVGAPLALLMATSGTDFTQPYAYQCFIYHAAMFWLALYLVITGQVRISGRDYLRNLLLLAGLGIVMIWINGAFITAGCTTVNFCFVVRPPAEHLPVLNMNHGWHVYFAHLASAAVLLETLVSLPFMLKKKSPADTLPQQ